MLLHVERALTPEQVAHFRAVLEAAAWVDGKVTAGAQSAEAKRNLQVPEDAPEARALGEIVLSALGRNEAFVSGALPLRVFPPLFNRYDAGMGFDSHVDNAIRFSGVGGVRFRTDLSATLFLSEPEDYEGGELVIDDAYGEHVVKLPAGDMIVYPASSVHRVTPITHGSRWASFFWIQSMVRDEARRTELWRMDQALGRLRGELGDRHEAVIALTGTYHNLVRAWGEV